MGIGKRIRQAREMRGLTQADLAAKIGVTPSAVANYEKEVSHPKEQILYAMFGALDVDANFLFQDCMNTTPFELSDDEALMIEKFRRMDSFDRQTIMILMDRFIDREPEPYVSDEPILYRTLPLYGARPAAGSGNDLPSVDTLYHSEIQVPDIQETKKADFVLEVDGHSMEPKLLDGDRILIHRQEVLNPGDIGVFRINDEVVVKQYKGDRLHSLNPDYQDIVPDESDTVSCFGKVIGKL